MDMAGPRPRQAPVLRHTPEGALLGRGGPSRLSPWGRTSVQPPTGAPGSLSSAPRQQPLLSPLVSWMTAVVAGAKGRPRVASIYISLMTDTLEHLLRACWPSVCLWENVYSKLLCSFFKYKSFFSWITSVLDILGINLLSNMVVPLRVWVTFHSFSYLWSTAFQKGEVKWRIPEIQPVRINVIDRFFDPKRNAL